MSEYATSPRYRALDGQWGSVVAETRLKGAWFRRAFVLMEEAGRRGGFDSPEFRDFIAHAPAIWAKADPIILRALSEVPSDVNT